jgi:general secretion pathway protein D
MLIVTDRANNVNRLVQIIRRIDQTGDQDVEIVPLQNASAAEIARIVSTVFQQQGAPDSGTPLKVVADERSNSVILSGDQPQRLRVRTLVAHLDTPLQTGGDSQVRYLKFADAEKLVPKLKEQITGIAQASAGATGAPAGPQAAAEKGALIWADPDTNALIVTAPPKVMRAVMSIVDRLDIRRAQVLVEAVIVEVSADKTAGLGVNWAAWTEGSDGTQIPAGGFISPVGGTSAADIYAALKGGSTSSAAATLNGTNFVLGKLTASGINVGAMVRAIRGDANTNIVATPSTVTMDNQEAELKVAQEVPFKTGEFQTSSSGSSSNPFSTIQRQEVGTILKVTPQIAAEGNLVVLKLSIESSSVETTSVSSVDITTNKRTIATSVMVEDGGIVVLGGLIRDSASRSEQRVPFLGNIPLLGLAFKTRDRSSTKSNLMIFIRPKILRDGVQTALATGAKYNYMIEEQRKADQRELLPLLPGVKSPRLQPLPAEPTEAPKSEAPKSEAPDPATATPRQ